MATPELNIDNVIGSGWFYEGITSRYVNRWLKENAKAKEILVRVNSPGGDVFDGHAIYSALARCEAHVIMEVEGLAASAASIILMAGDERRIHKGAFVMIHESQGGTMGTAEDHEKTADLLRKINGEMAVLYAERSGQTHEKCLEMMAANETWLTASEAVELGFCDAVIAAKGTTPPPKRAAAKMIASFKHAPSALLATINDRGDDVETPARAQIHVHQIRAARPPLSELARGAQRSRIGDL